MPSSNLGDLLVADRAEAVLLLPEMAEPSSPFESGFHLHVEAFFKICFPSRVVGIGFLPDFRLPLNADRRSSEQSNHFHLSFFALEDACEDPTVWPFIGKVFVFHPSARFVSMSSACPFPNRLEDGMVNGFVDRRTHHVAMIECPPTDLWVEFRYQIPCGQVAAFFDTLSDLPKEGLDVLLRWGNEKLRTFPFLILAYRLSQKIKSLFDMRHDSLFG